MTNEYDRPGPPREVSEDAAARERSMTIDYHKAGEIALVAMGRTEPRRNSPSKWRAEDDPLAWWCLTEWIAEQGRYRERKNAK